MQRCIDEADNRAIDGSGIGCRDADTELENRDLPPRQSTN
jgi:hypothetical protein